MNKKKPEHPQIDEEFLKEEYFHLQNVVEEFDKKALTIKAWSITASLAAIAAAFAEKADELCLVASVSSIFFWLIESYWKTFQQSYYPRIDAIEEYFSGKREDEFHQLQISSFWYPHWKKRKGRTLFNSIFRWPHVYLPHAPIAFGGILIYILNMFFDFI